jgi:hypothetical protein
LLSVRITEVFVAFTLIVVAMGILMRRLQAGPAAS